jgi:HEAT repeat protein
MEGVMAVAAAPIAVALGCGKAKKPRPAHRAATQQKSMGALLVDVYVADLEKGPDAKRIKAADELANMGSAAKRALPALEKLARSADESVRDAAARAIRSIRKIP